MAHVPRAFQVCNHFFRARMTTNFISHFETPLVTGHMLRCFLDASVATAHPFIIKVCNYAYTSDHALDRKVKLRQGCCSMGGCIELLLDETFLHS
jgi:hypothetical protein